ncbi:MAG: hypothetical protein ACKVWV_06000 [Planctomycetota bacterium]
MPWIPLALASLALVAREGLRRRTELGAPVAARTAAQAVLPSLALRAEPPRDARSTWSVDAEASTAVIDGGSRPTLRVEGRVQLARDGSLAALDLELVPALPTARERCAVHASELSRASAASPIPGVATGGMRLRVGGRSRAAFAVAAWSFDSAGRMHLAVRTHAGIAQDGDVRALRTYDGEPRAQRLGLYLVLRNDD